MLQDDGDADGRDQRGQAWRIAQGAIGDAFNRVPDQRAGRDRGQHAEQYDH